MMNEDEFEDSVGLDDTFDDFSESGASRGSWKNNPLVKVGVVVGALVCIFLVVGFLFSDEEQVATSQVGSASSVNVAPGTEEATPAYINAIEEENEAIRQQAEATGGSALPVPIEPPVGVVNIPADVSEEEDPLRRWRRLQEERLQREIQQREQIAAVPTNDTQRADAVADLAQVMQEQMSTILGTKSEQRVSSLQLTSSSFLDAREEDKDGDGSAAEDGSDDFNEEIIQETLLPAGEVLYAQLLVEANSDVPGPVLAEIVNGPLKGSRIIGTFETLEVPELLVLNFNTVVYNEESLSIEAVALDPETTLPGMATDVDHHYLKRIILPAAAAFIEGFSSAVAEGGQTNITISSGGGATSETENDLDSDQEVATGVTEAGKELRSILDDMANETKVSIHIAAGTPIGVLFTAPVETQDSEL